MNSLMDLIHLSQALDAGNWTLDKPTIVLDYDTFDFQHNLRVKYTKLFGFPIVWKTTVTKTVQEVSYS